MPQSDVTQQILVLIMTFTIICAMSVDYQTLRDKFPEQKIVNQGISEHLSSKNQHSKHQKYSGCSAAPLLPKLPFFVVWNHPSQGCQSHGVKLDFAKWGIVDNTDDSFIGEEIALLYGVGHFPVYSKGTPQYGGIPQLGNLTSHLQKVITDINKALPSASFSGLAVIDFEAWRPLLSLNFDALKIYKQKSIELAQHRFPQYNTSQILQEATREFEAAARLSWIYNMSTGLFPSIYFSRSLPDASRAAHIQHVIHETLRVKATWSSQDVVVFPYSLSQDNSTDLFNKSDLSYSILQPANMGSSGVVLWGSSSFMQDKRECLILQEYINTTLGPFVLQATSFFTNCSQQLCQGHGRCVRKDYEEYYQHFLRKRGHSPCLISDSQLARNTKKQNGEGIRHINANIKFVAQLEKSSVDSILNGPLLVDENDKQTLSDFDDYVCKCFAGWSGVHCEQGDV